LAPYNDGQVCYLWLLRKVTAGEQIFVDCGPKDASDPNAGHSGAGRRRRSQVAGAGRRRSREARGWE
jgi:hypothetical protein